MLRRLRMRRSFWSALALGILAVPAMFGGTAAAPHAEGESPLPPPEPNPLAILPPDPADLLAALLKANTQLINDLAPDRYQMLIVETAHRYRLDPRLIASVITVETRWNPNAVGAHGERGLMQILPSTGAWLARKMGRAEYDLADPQTSIEFGAYYLAMLLAEYGDPRRALAVYNGGPRAAHGWENNLYMRQVMKVYNSRPQPEKKPRPDMFPTALVLAS